MKSLSAERRELIEAIAAESTAQISVALLEKDEHLTDALRAVFELRFEHVALAFCGGSCLSKAHGLIERMSEDADLKVILVTDEAKSWSAHKLRTYLRSVCKEVCDRLTEVGFVLDHKRVLNEYRYIGTQWSYERKYPEAAALRPSLQLELTCRTPVLGTQSKKVLSLADRIAQREQGFEVPSVCVAETAAEKVLSFLRRFAQHRAGKMHRDWDVALVRHIYDVHCISKNAGAELQHCATVFSALVEGDKLEFGRQHEEFAANAGAVLSNALQKVKNDEQTQLEYEQHLLPLVYGSYRPPFDEALASFELLASKLLATEQPRVA